ncbi:YadA C-terminal domain-containing protein [Morganella morganii]|uniref:YadA C-terminal domain-containing protein n=1 Tax=Morganella morganii TaxID=582 RepID=UPI0021D10BC6|nr:YadA-like family protein [Morganella morganii]MCU6376927.1 YadA-like family protein [Morganella morganii]
MKKTVLALFIFPFFAYAEDMPVYETGISPESGSPPEIYSPPHPELPKPTLAILEGDFYGTRLSFSEKKNKGDRSVGVSEAQTIFNHLNQRVSGIIDQADRNIGEFKEEMQYEQSSFMEEAKKLEYSVERLTSQVNAHQQNVDSTINATLDKAMPAYIDRVLPEKIGQYMPGIQKDVIDQQIADVAAEHTASLKTEVNELNTRVKSVNTRTYLLDDAITENENAIIANRTKLKSQSDEIQQNKKLLESAKVVTSAITDATLALEADVAKMDTRISNASKKAGTALNVANQNTKSIDGQKVKVEKNTLDILKNRQDLRALENDLRETNERLDNGLAASAALNGLFQPYGVGKLNITAAVGGYQSTQAVAVGTGYRFNENIAVKTGMAYTGSNDVMYNMAVNLEW